MAVRVREAAAKAMVVKAKVREVAVKVREAAAKAMVVKAKVREAARARVVVVASVVMRATAAVATVRPVAVGVRVAEVVGGLVAVRARVVEPMVAAMTGPRCWRSGPAPRQPCCCHPNAGIRRLSSVSEVHGTHQS